MGRVIQENAVQWQLRNFFRMWEILILSTQHLSNALYNLSYLILSYLNLHVIFCLLKKINYVQWHAKRMTVHFWTLIHEFLHKF